MGYGGKSQIRSIELRAGLLAIEMLISVSGLSVPGLIEDEIWIVEGDESPVIFELKMRINATDF